MVLWDFEVGRIWAENRSGTAFLYPRADAERIDADAEQIGGDESELTGSQADNADDDAVQAGHGQPRPTFAANQNCRKNRKAAGQII